jgi:hypothetical protein
LFSNNEGKGNQSCKRIDGPFSSVLMGKDLHAAESIFHGKKLALALAVSVISFVINALLGR